MKNTVVGLCIGCLCLIAPWARAQQPATDLDLRRAAPMSAHLAIYAKHNPERDYQREYFAQVWQTIQDEQIGPRFLKIITSRMQEDRLSHAQQVVDEFRTALDPVLNESLLECQEVVVAQQMEFPTNQTLVLAKYPGDTAVKLETAFKNVLGLVQKYSDNKVPVSTYSQGDVEITGLALPAEVPFKPSCARLDNVFLFSTSQTMLGNALQALQNGSAESKFDDPRLTEALQYLPKPEDSLVFFDAKQLFSQLRNIGSFVKAQAHGQDNPELDRFVAILNLTIDEVSVVDYEVTVEYTEGNENRTATFGRCPEDAQQKLLGKMLLGGKPFEDWQSWIPADATAYSLSTGVRLHEAYEHVMDILKTKFPETRDALQKFDEIQDQIDLHLDTDILQSFSGENVSVTLPADGQGQESVCALRCTNPDRIRELLHRLVEGLNKIPAVATQQLKLVESEDLPGFETLNASILAAFNVKPVIGFSDSWMIFGSNAAAVQKVLDARAGSAPTIDSSEQFERFHLPIEAPVYSLNYTDLAAQAHNAAGVIRKIGAVAPMFLAMAGANANAEEMKPVMEAVALLPSVANVVEKFDFYQARLSTVTEGPMPNTYLKQSVTLIRAPSSESE